jgi:hypothetical protein
MQLMAWVKPIKQQITFVLFWPRRPSTAFLAGLDILANEAPLKGNLPYKNEWLALSWILRRSFHRFCKECWNYLQCFHSLSIDPAWVIFRVAEIKSISWQKANGVVIMRRLRIERERDAVLITAVRYAKKTDAGTL